MKYFIILTLLFLAQLLPTSASAYDFKVDGICYNIINDNEIEITRDGYCSGDVIIPATVTYNGKTYLVTTITDLAFNGWSEMTSITIPSSVTTIGSSVISNCSALTNVSVANDNPNYDSRDNCNAIIETVSNTLIAGCQSTLIPSSITNIGNEAFLDCSGLTNVIVPNSVTTIGDDVFCGCSCLSNVIIPNSVTHIGRYAFGGCGSLTSITIPNSITTINEGLFDGCWQLSSVNIPASVTSIGDYAFSGCSRLISITIPNTVTTIGRGSFFGCSSLTTIDIPNSVTTIGIHAFTDCIGITSVTIPNSVAYIGDVAFYGCSGLISIVIPNSVTYIGSEAFEGTPWYDNQPDGLVYAGLVAYKYKGMMPDETNILLRDGTLGIAGGAFRECGSLTGVTIPNTVINIGDCAFYGCRSLNSVSFSDAVTTIGYAAFSGCIGLTSMTIPNSVIYIGDNAFDDCSGLTDMYSYLMDLSKVSMGTSVFWMSGNDYSKRTLHVLYGMSSVYQADRNWSLYFGNIVEMDEPPVSNLKGDMNDDGILDVSDVTMLISLILSQ